MLEVSSLCICFAFRFFVLFFEELQWNFEKIVFLCGYNTCILLSNEKNKNKKQINKVEAFKIEELNRFRFFFWKLRRF